MRRSKRFLLALLIATACSVPAPPTVEKEEWAFINMSDKRISLVLQAHDKADKVALKRALRGERRARRQLSDAEMARRAAEEELARASLQGWQVSARNVGAAAGNERGVESTEKALAEKTFAAAAGREEQLIAFVSAATQQRAAVEEDVQSASLRRRQLSEERAALARAAHLEPTQEKFERLMDLNTEIAHEFGIASQVTWRTIKVKKGKVGPSPGAVLYYQTKRGRERGDRPESLRGTTECREPITLGRYYVWAVRGTRVTSDMNRLVYISDYASAVEIVED